MKVNCLRIQDCNILGEEWWAAWYSAIQLVPSFSIFLCCIQVDYIETVGNSQEPIVFTAYFSQIGGMQRGIEHRSQLEERHGKVECGKVSKLTNRSCERLQKLDIELPKHTWRAYVHVWLCLCKCVCALFGICVGERIFDKWNVLIAACSFYV